MEEKIVIYEEAASKLRAALKVKREARVSRASGKVVEVSPSQSLWFCRGVDPTLLDSEQGDKEWPIKVE